jgi:hypothetical protein
MSHLREGWISTRRGVVPNKASRRSRLAADLAFRLRVEIHQRYRYLLAAPLACGEGEHSNFYVLGEKREGRGTQTTHAPFVMVKITHTQNNHSLVPQGGGEGLQIHNSRKMNQILPARRDIPRSLRGCTHLTYTYTNIHIQICMKKIGDQQARQRWAARPCQHSFIQFLTLHLVTLLHSQHPTSLPSGQKVVLFRTAPNTCIKKHHHHHLNLPHSRDHRTIMTHVRLSQETPLHFS